MNTWKLLFSILWITLQCMPFPRAWAADTPSDSESRYEERESPDFGRPDEPLTLSEGLLWVPRVAFFPAYLATEYLLRTPLNLLGRAAELNNLPLVVIDFFKFGEDNRFGLFPTFLVDFGFRSSFGVYFFMKRFVSDKDTLSVRAATGGVNYLRLSVTDDYPLDEERKITTNFTYNKRADFIFHDLGPLSLESARSRYSAEEISGFVRYRQPVFEEAAMQFEAGVKDVGYGESFCCDEPNIGDQISNGSFPAPPRFTTGFTAIRQKIDFQWGKPISRPTRQFGGKLDLALEHAFDVSGGSTSRWVIYGGALTSYWHIHRFRTLKLSVDTRLADSLGDRDVPFSELPFLGGSRPLPGFLSGRLVGQSSFAVTAEYLWPIQAFLDGIIHFGMGNVFGKGLDGLRLGLFRKSIGMGIQAAGSDSVFGFLLAFGSQSFDDGGRFNEFRIQLRFSSEI